NTAKILFSDPEIHLFLRINRHNDVLWFNREAFRKLIKWLLIIEMAKSESNISFFTESIKIAADSGYRVEIFLDSLKESGL
ncbi:MAG: hypothetical protein ACTSRU_11380, partial [Candidatus Hodarchaeales archaeon]